MRKVWFLGFVIAVFLLVALAASPAFGANRNGTGGVPNAALQQSWVDLDQELLPAFQSADDHTTYVVQLVEKADLSPAYSISDWDERGAFVVESLQEVAQRTQSGIVALLQAVKWSNLLLGCLKPG